MLRTCTDCDGLHELVSPGVRPHHQRQVGLLDQLIDGALCETTSKSRICIFGSASKLLQRVEEEIHVLDHMMALASSCRVHKARCDGSHTPDTQIWWLYFHLRRLEDAYEPYLLLKLESRCCHFQAEMKHTCSNNQGLVSKEQPLPTLNSYDSSIMTSSLWCSPSTGFPISAMRLASSSSDVSFLSGTSER